MTSLASPSASNTDSSVLTLRIGNEIRNIGIPPRPSILGRIEAEMRAEEPDFRLLGNLIGADVGLAASVIKVANSPFFGSGRKVRTVADALLVLGLKVTVNTVAGIALQQTFPHVPSLERFWDSATRSARVSAWLAQQLGKRTRLRPDDAYTFGLFRDCGVPVLMIPFPEYPKILMQANNEAVRLFTVVEDELLSINHAVVGAQLAQDWLLPDEVASAIQYHHDPAAFSGPESDSVPLDAKQMIAIAQLAEYLIQQHTGLNKSQEWNKLGAACTALLGIAEDELAALLSEAGEVVSAAL